MKYEYDFTNLHLPKLEYKLLRKVSRHTKVKYTILLDNLIQVGLITYCKWTPDENGNNIPIKDKCIITEKGLCYLQYCRNHFIDVRTPVIISLFALLVAFASFIITA